LRRHARRLPARSAGRVSRTDPHSHRRTLPIRRGHRRTDAELQLFDRADLRSDRRAVRAGRLHVPRVAGLAAMAKLEAVRIFVTHGTGTMVETARILAAAFPGGGDKTIVLTGAMIPYAFGSSDGLFNLGSALSFVQVLPPGVYVSMNGRCFRWDRVRKNRETGIFEST